MGKVKTSLSFNDATWKEFRKRCIDENKKYTDVLEDLMRQWLKKRE